MEKIHPIFVELSHLWFELVKDGSILMGRLANDAPYFERRMFLKLSYINMDKYTYIEFEGIGGINGKGLIRAVATHQALPSNLSESAILLAISGPRMEHF